MTIVHFVYVVDDRLERPHWNMQVSGELLRQCISCWTMELILTRYCTIEFLHAHLTFRLSERAWYTCTNNSHCVHVHSV